MEAKEKKLAHGEVRDLPVASSLDSMLEQAEGLLKSKAFGQARELAQAVLNKEPDRVQAWLILAESSPPDCEVDELEGLYRQALTASPDEPRALLGLARLLRRANRDDEARSLLFALLEKAPAQVEAAQLLFDCLTELEQVEQFEPYLNAALAKLPHNPRVRILHGRYLISTGLCAEGTAIIREVLSSNSGYAGAWKVLILEAEARGAYDEALRLQRDGVVACPRDGGLVGRYPLMLAAANRQAECDAFILAQTIPAIDDKAFMWWATRMRKLDASGVVHRALEQADPAARLALAETPNGVQLQFALARETGDLQQAIDWLRHFLSSHPKHAPLLREFYHLALCDGDTSLAGETASRLHKLDPKHHGRIPTYLLHEARIFPAAMAHVQEAMQRDPAERLVLLSRVVQDEPGCLPAALAWVIQFQARCTAGSMASAGGSAIPRLLHHGQALGDDWHAQHRDYQWRDINEQDQQSAVFDCLSPQARRGFRRHPEDARMDITRLISLKNHGGWWVGKDSPCNASLEVLTNADTRLVLHLDDKGFVTSELIGCVAGHEVIEEALEIALMSLDEAPRQNSSNMATGRAALTLGLASALSRRILQGEWPQDVVVINNRRRERWLTMEWPK